MSNTLPAPRSRTSKDSNELDPIDRIILTHQWYITNEYKDILNHHEFFVSTIADFLDHCDHFEDFPWQYEITMTGLEKGLDKEHRAATREHFYRVEYHNVSMAYLVQTAQTNPKLTVCFQLRIHTRTNFYLCLVRLNKPDWKPLEGTVWKPFPAPLDSGAK